MLKSEATLFKSAFKANDAVIKSTTFLIWFLHKFTSTTINHDNEDYDNTEREGKKATSFDIRVIVKVEW